MEVVLANLIFLENHQICINCIIAQVITDRDRNIIFPPDAVVIPCLAKRWKVETDEICGYPMGKFSNLF